MTPKQKAEELVSKFISNQNKWYLENLVDGLRIAQAKQCALIAVDEILVDIYYYVSHPQQKLAIIYWQEVKQEIYKL